MNVQRCDFCVIGGGIAGLSMAAELSRRQRVILLEREPQLAYHATGRSAALYAPSYGNQLIRALTRASRAALAGQAPDGGPDVLTLRGALFVARDEQRDQIDALAAEIGDAGGRSRRLDPGALADCVPVLAPSITAGLLDEDACDIDTATLVDSFRRALQGRGGLVLKAAPVQAVEARGAGWRVAASAATIECDIVVDAAGAWADEVAGLAGVAPLGLRPLRRSVALVDLPAGLDARTWPCVVDADEQFYFKPDAGRLLLSAADEVPSQATDARPEELEIATALDRVEHATTLKFQRVASTWAGLRTFAADRSPVIGFDPVVAGFFWLAGQGGYGLQTAPAAAATAAALARGDALPGWVVDQGVTAAALSPARLRSRDVA